MSTKRIYVTEDDTIKFVTEDEYSQICTRRGHKLATEDDKDYIDMEDNYIDYDFSSDAQYVDDLRELQQ